MFPTVLLAFLTAAAPSHRALWVWDSGAGEEVVSFAHDRGITDLFLQWSPSANPERLRGLLHAATRQGIAVHALDGWPEAALPEQHAEVLKVVDAVIRFNANAPSGERFHGIHLDVEPYLLAGFDGPLRSEILAGMVELQNKVAARTAASGLEYGCDLPFWFDDATMDAVLQAAGNVGIMDYRNRAEGPDGIVEHARKWIAAGDRLHKKVWISVETAPAEASEARLVASFSEAEWQKPTGGAFSVLRMSRFEGFRVAVESRDGRRHVGLAGTASNAALARLREAAQKAGAKPEDWRKTTPALPKTTFDGQSRTQMEEQLRAVEAALGNSPSFYGVAIHHLGSYRKMW